MMKTTVWLLSNIRSWFSEHVWNSFSFIKKYDNIMLMATCNLAATSLSGLTKWVQIEVYVLRGSTLHTHLYSVSYFKIYRSRQILRMRQNYKYFLKSILFFQQKLFVNSLTVQWQGISKYLSTSVEQTVLAAPTMQRTSADNLINTRTRAGYLLWAD